MACNCDVELPLEMHGQVALKERNKVSPLVKQLDLEFDLLLFYMFGIEESYNTIYSPADESIVANACNSIWLACRAILSVSLHVPISIPIY